MTNRFWPRVLLLALLALTLVAIPAPTRAAAPAALFPLPRLYSYNCSVSFGDLGPDRVTCNGVQVPNLGDWTPGPFYTAQVKAGQTLTVTGSVSGGMSNSGVLKVEGAGLNETRTFNQASPFTWHNTTGATQSIKLTWKPYFSLLYSYQVQGLVRVQ